MRLTLLATLAVAAICAQSTFEVASVKPSTPEAVAVTPTRNGGGAACPMRFTVTGERMEARCQTLAALIARAFGVPPDQIRGPGWLDTRFDISATIPAGSAENQIPAMLQGLLRERFRLAAHRETVQQTVYGLVVARDGPRFQQARGASSIKRTTDADGVEHVEATCVTLVEFADLLSAEVVAAIPVQDMTRLGGRYDIVLEIPWRELPAAEAPRGAALDPAIDPTVAAANFDLLQRAVRKLGLDLQRRRGPIDRIVIDSVEKTPSEN